MLTALARMLVTDFELALTMGVTVFMQSLSRQLPLRSRCLGMALAALS
jgi:hypothetical protein